MPYRLRIHLKGPTPQSAYQHSAGLRALLLSWIEEQNPDLSQAFHDANQPKPYTVSPLNAASSGQHSLFFDVSLTTDWLLEMILNSCPKTGNSIRLGPQGFMVSAEPEIIVADSWETLIEGARPFKRATVTLMSPTASHAPGILRKVIVLPAPENYFGSWFGRWNNSSPVPMSPELLEVVRERIVVSHCAGETERALIDGKRPFLGFVGQVTFEILKREDIAPAGLKALSSLVRYANYCGTGVETIRGMGQTRTY
jgi:CRISPR-associated endoribonuclease Cas6